MSKRSLYDRRYTLSRRTVTIDVVVVEAKSDDEALAVARKSNDWENVQKDWDIVIDDDDNSEACSGCDAEDGCGYYRSLDCAKACDDCGCMTNELVQKGDHHGGLKTVCIDRADCHRRSS